MCLIVDANSFGDFLSNSEMKPAIKWLKDRNGRVAYSHYGKIKKELYDRQRNKFEQYDKAGYIRRVSPKKVTKEEKTLPSHLSDDPHMLALAKAANAKRLISRDEKLEKDFKNKDIIEDGKVYKNSSHRKLFINYTCPA